MAENVEKNDTDDKKNETKQLNVRISLELHEKLDAVNEPKGMVVTKALEYYFSESEKKDDAAGLSPEYVNALLKQLETKDKQIEELTNQLTTKDTQITERDNTTKMHIAQVQTLINQLEKKQLELEAAKPAAENEKKKWYHFW